MMICYSSGTSSPWFIDLVKFSKKTTQLEEDVLPRSKSLNNSREVWDNVQLFQLNISYRDRIKDSLKESDDAISSVVYKVYQQLVYPEYLSNADKLVALEQVTQTQVSNSGRPINYLQVQSDPYLVTPELVKPRFSEMINFPRSRKLTVFDPEFVATPI